MSNKQTRRALRSTIFIYCEGKTDALFVQHLKNLYLQRGTKQIDIKKGSGGGDSTFISVVKKVTSSADYDKKYIVLDSNGKTEEKKEELEESAKREEIQLIWQQPCLEGVFLRILKGEKFITAKSSQHCKSIFNKKYSNNKLLDTSVLEKILSKGILDKKRKQLLELNQLIQLMEE